MLFRLAALSALVLGSVTAAQASPISGFFSVTGTDTFTNGSVTFGSGVVAGALGGDFASYLTDGTIVNFVSGPLSLATNGTSQTVGPPLVLFTTTASGETFSFNLTDYTASYVNNGTNGCTSGSTCLTATGNGYFTATGPLSGTSGMAVFAFTSQYVLNQPLTSVTSFSASTFALAPVPEPASLALVGSGILGVAAFARRRLKL